MSIQLYEELSMNALPALQTQIYDGWVLRFSKGYTNRANSVNPLYPAALPLEEKVAFCERLYAAQGLPTAFKITEAAPAGLDDYLDARGYEIVTPTRVFTCPAPPAGEACGDVVITRDTAVWREDGFRLSNTDAKMIPIASAMMDRIQGNVLCAKILADGRAVACGQCVEERGHAGLYGIVVDPAYRRCGLGYALCKALLIEAAGNGAEAFYLQVVADNGPAAALYRKLGFVPCYGYHYRVLKGVT